VVILNGPSFENRSAVGHLVPDLKRKVQRNCHQKATASQDDSVNKSNTENEERSFDSLCDPRRIAQSARSG
jgi:hypothetical protein